MTTRKQIWFLTGSQGLYGPDVLDQVADNSRALAAKLDDAGLVADVVWRPVLTSKEAIRRAALDANSDDACVGVVAWMHTFSPAKMWIAGLEALRTPLLHLHTQANDALPWATIDMDFMNLNQAAHGDREFGHVEARLGVARKTVAGSVNDPEVRRRIGVWARAALAWDDGQHAKLVRFGDNMRDVAVTEGDKVEAERVFGVSVNTHGVNELVDAVAEVTDAEAAALAAEYEDLYAVAPQLRRGGERHAALVYGARQEIALRAFLQSHGATAFTTNFEDLGGLRQLPGLAVQRLTASGYGFGAEGDWKTAILVRLAKVMGAGLAGGASLMEDYTYHLVPGQEKILGAHMLEVCPSLTTARPSLEIHPLGIGGREDPVRLVFTADPGPAVVVGLADMGARFRLTLNTVEVTEPDEPLPRLPVARAVWRPDPGFHTSAECWLIAGAPHHTCMFTAPGAAELFADYAELARVELAVIGPGASAESFARGLRWNQAYYHLARGL
ncbi:MAG: L-arabinose isomerase [Propionibacteriaceae bacterium]|jgi:L-arabinose isomerase|nr:L-arabinose isomerase [Propionibacteriaceae bacterium]